ncbi:MAG: LysM peptidoglycan-binding domain-containing protein [Firmicutes bacterium]|jgi:LysM repeat protein|nr:LysM peptidoglycan-binding domain-containing protein [Bacillota bacterium]HHX73834.1 LysM peptidoglycan-binding domain-containing protein [Bacillota bacterium]
MKTLSGFTYRRRLQAKKQKTLCRISGLLLICLLVVAITVFNGGVAAGSKEVRQTVIVAEGDTLWSIAGRFLPDGTDIRSYISMIRSHNNLAGTLVYPGQILALP